MPPPLEKRPICHRRCHSPPISIHFTTDFYIGQDRPEIKNRAGRSDMRRWSERISNAPEMDFDLFGLRPNRTNGALPWVYARSLVGGFPNSTL